MAKGTQSGGNCKITARRYQERKTEKGRICTGCNKDRESSEYYPKASRCKYCYKKAYDKRQKKKVKLW